MQPDFRQMENKNEFRIPVSGLALGNHTYQFEIKDDFFAVLEYSEIQQGNVTVRLDVEREETMMTLKFGIKGEVRVQCDRCADEFDLPIEDERVFFIKLGDENAEESEDVAVVSADQADFDVSSLIYEFIILAIPMHRVHPEGKCNPEIMALLLSDQNNEEDIDDSDEIDPRWAALKDLKLNDK